MDSSTRFLNTDSWNKDNHFHPSPATSPVTSPATSPAPAKLRLMCSSGGHIVPRPHNKTLCYIGGETRMVVIDRKTSLQNLTHRLSKTLLRSPSPATSPFTLKYQLPSEDLDSLISVTTDEDLENMIEEYERLNSVTGANKTAPSRLRLFLFPASPDSGCLIGSGLENLTKSEDWFLNALNGSSSGLSDTSSVNCLLGLEDELSPPENKNGNYKNTLVTNLSNSGQDMDIQSVPGSPLMDTTSSFGSASSTPAPVVVSGSPVSSVMTKTENSDQFLFYHDRSEQGLQMDYLNQPQFHQKQSTGFDLASNDSILSDSSQFHQIQNNNQAGDPSTPDQKSKIQFQEQQKAQNSAFLLPMPTTQMDTKQPQSHHQQLQFIQPLQYFNHHPTYYHPHQPQIDQQNFVYYIPTTQPQPPQGYNFALQQPQPPTAAPKTNSGGPQLVRVHSGVQNQPQYYPSHALKRGDFVQ